MRGHNKYLCTDIYNTVRELLRLAQMNSGLQEERSFMATFEA